MSLSLGVPAPRATKAFAVAWPFILDWSERLLLVGLSYLLVQRVLTAGGSHLINGLQLLCEGIVVVAVLLRRSTNAVSRRPMDWVFGATGTAMPLLAAAGGTPMAPVWLCACLMMSGFLIQLSAKAVLWRSFGVVAANRGVKREGPYRFVRHPMYAGYVFMYVGYILYNPTWQNAAIYAVCLVCMVFRILCEERVLRDDAAYVEYAKATRHRLAPMVW